MKRLKRPLCACLLLFLSVALAGCREAPFEPWPPRTGNNDALAEAAGVSVEVVHVISSGSALRMDGRRDLAGAQFLPLEGKWNVLGGELTSALGAVHRSARFGSWTLFYADDERDEIVGWGPCLMSGEVIVPNVFLAEPAPHRSVPNAFAVEDLGPYHSLLRLDESRADRLCFGYRPADGSGYHGNLTATGALTLSGQVDPAFTQSDRMLFGTAGDAGSVVRLGELTLRHLPDGWYLGELRVGPPGAD